MMGEMRMEGKGIQPEEVKESVLLAGKKGRQGRKGKKGKKLPQRLFEHHHRHSDGSRISSFRRRS